jgi:hypothetical protein
MMAQHCAMAHDTWPRDSLHVMEEGAAIRAEKSNKEKHTIAVLFLTVF